MADETDDEAALAAEATEAKASFKTEMAAYEAEGAAL